jgi:hypothetical protein
LLTRSATGIRIDEGFLQESFRLNFPHRQARPVDALLQDHNIFNAEAPCKISRRRWFGNPLGTQTIEKHLILPPQFDVFQPLAAS